MVWIQVERESCANMKMHLIPKAGPFQIYMVFDKYFVFAYFFYALGPSDFRR